MSMPWFRMYHEFATDPKVQMLSEVDQRRFVMLLCLRCCNGESTVTVTLQDEAAAFQLRISIEEYRATKARLVERGLIDEQNCPVNWGKRQAQSDSSKSRVYKHREAKKRACNGDVTVMKRPRNGLEIEEEVEEEEEREEKNNTPAHFTGDAAREKSGQGVFKGSAKRSGQGPRGSLVARVEGLGLRIDPKGLSDEEFAANAESALAACAPGLARPVIRRALAGDRAAYTHLTAVLMAAEDAAQ